MSNDESKFKQLYASLNSAQKEAVDTVEGPVMVIAGPGTGKTQILTLRIANILKKTDASPDSILALTFTESGAYSMRKRLVEIIGPAGYRVHIHTFHSFCNEIIKEYPDEFPRVIGSTNLSDVEKIVILKRLIDETKLKLLKPYGDPYFYLHDIRSAISEAKRENLSPGMFKEKLKEEKEALLSNPDLHHEKGVHKGKRKTKYDREFKNLEKNEELVLLYCAYERELQSEGRYDYEDMIMEVIRELKVDEQGLLRTLQEEYQYILADEHQDTNTAQNVLLELLAGYFEEPNLFVVGDEKQAIFRFQGATLENFLYFKRRFPKARVITLTDNYRSSQNILDASHSVIASSSEDVEGLGIERPSLVSKKEKGKSPIQIAALSQVAYEYRYIVDEIENLIDNGVPAKEIAILYRDNKDVEPLLSVLEKSSVPFVIESDQNLLGDPYIEKFLMLLRAIRYYGESGMLADTLHVDFLDLPHLDIYKLIRWAGEGKSLYGALKNSDLHEKLEIEESDKFVELARKLSSWRSVAKNRPLLETFEIVSRESGYLEHLLGSEESLEAVEKLSRLFAEAETLVERHKGYSLEDFMHHLELMREHNVYLKKAERRESEGKVRLMTAHRSKGLEFDYVFIIGTTDGHWGNRRVRGKLSLPTVSKDSADNESDERRLFYVALTRARKSVTITYSSAGEGGKLTLPSQFIEEIDNKLKDVVDVNKYEDRYKDDLEHRFAPRTVRGVSAQDHDYLRELFDNQGLSVTALNNYLVCPWQYFYRNLVRLPSPQTRHQMYGTAVHETLKRFFNKLGDEGADKKELVRLFNDELSKLPFDKGDFVSAQERGEGALSGYFDEYSGKWHLPTITELYIRGVVLPVSEGEVKLRGALDKVELLEPERDGGAVNVVDYKTAKPKSRNEILGETKSSSGEYHRQLVFYRLLLDLYADGKYKMQEGVIDFVEPNERGKYKQERFSVSLHEVSDLKGEIDRVVGEIREFSFWEERCDQKECKYCALREMMA